MECLRLTVYSFILLGCSILQSEAGFFDPSLNIFNTQQRDSASSNVINSLLSPFRGNVDNQRPDLRPLKDREPVRERPWWKSVSTQSPIIQHIFKDQTTIKSTTSDYDAIVAKSFPEGVKLLENLKGLNKLKEERDRKATNSEREARARKDGYGDREAWARKDGYGERVAREHGYGEKEARESKDGNGEKEARERKDGNDEKEARERKDGNGKTDTVVPKPMSNGNETKSNDNDTKSKDNETKPKDIDTKSTEKPIVQEKSGEGKSEIDSALGVITKKQFYYQVQPIRPESERDFFYERMYYVN